jgi:hypothetical protein
VSIEEFNMSYSYFALMWHQKLDICHASVAHHVIELYIMFYLMKFYKSYQKYS